MTRQANRRAILAGTAIATVFGAGQASAQNWWPFGRRGAQEAQNTPAQHEGHTDHGAHHATSHAALSAEENAMIAALAECDTVGEACLTHCLALLAQGDATMATCASGVREMLAVCGAARTLMQSRSALAGAQLAVCRDACSACRAACQPHAGHHAECAACAQACERTVAAIDALLS